MKTKEVSIIVIYRGQLPIGFDHEEVEEKIQEKLEDCFRLYFNPEDDEYDEEIHEPFFDRADIIISEDGYDIRT